ncbi:MAG: TonB-dependent receptor [Nitrospira sp.]|nr:TonB-dependent receptor [Nitrospira sp.]
MMHLSWQVVVTLSVSAVLVHTAGNLAEARSERLTTSNNSPLLLAQATAAAETSDTVDFNIPPQALGSAITAFGDQANYRLLLPSDLAEGRSTSGVSGRHTPQEALALMLAGTGLSYRMTEARTMTLEPVAVTPLPLAPLSQEPAPPNPNTQAQAVPKPVKVPEIVVKEVEDRGYAVDESSSATRIPAPIHDTPRSVEVVTRQVLDDQKVIRFSEALRNVSGVSQSSTQGGQGGTFMIRGFASDLNVFKNGFRDDSTFSARAQRDIINIESVEVVKGPPSYLYGRSDPGGVINQVTKAPLRNPYYSAEMIVGSYGLYRPTIDIGGPLNESKTLTYRFNGMYESAESYRDGVKTERIFLAPTFGWEMSSRTTLRFEAEYMYDRAPIDRGLVAIGNGVAPIPVSRFLGDPSRKLETHHGKATITLLHDISKMFRWRTAFRAAVTSSRYSSLESNFLVGAESDGILNLARYEIPTTV